MRLVNPQRDLLFADFNQDFSCLAIGTKTGFKVFNCDPFGKCFENAEGGIGIVEMLFCTNLVAIVGAGEQPAFSPRRLMIKNTKRQSTICELTFPTSVISVQMNRQRLAVVLESSIYIYDLSNMKLLHTIDTAYNPNAIVSLSPDSKACYLAYPSASPSSSGIAQPPGTSTVSQPPVSGDVTIFDTLSLHAVTIISAHKAPLSIVSFSPNGALLATASNKGTVIRVFSVPDGAKLFQFRRGTYPARIHSLNFNLSVSMLVCSSETETVHLFKLVNGASVSNEASEPGTPVASDYDFHAADLDVPVMQASMDSSAATPHSPTSGYMSPSPAPHSAGLVGSLIGTATGTLGSLWNKRASLNAYLPEFVSGMLEPHRDFAWMKVPGSSGDKSLAAFSSSSQHVFVVTNDGVLHQFALNTEKGGECVLVKQHRLVTEEPT
ncbi:autophagy protein [Sorochytrium milnesiophthora]